MTAYEMRISDWSSDVCSSDLRIVDHREPLDAPRDPIAAARFDGHPRLWRQPPLGTVVGVHEQYHAIVIHPAIAIAVAVDRGVVLIVRAHRSPQQQPAIVARRVPLQPRLAEEHHLPCGGWQYPPPRGD